MKKTLRPSLAALLLLALLPLEAQEEDAATPSDDPLADEVFVERVEVNVVNVDVYVTDKDDNPVTGLTVDDFEVFEDGRKVPISNFYAVEDGDYGERARALAEANPVEPLRREGVRLEPLPVPEDQRLYLVLYFDNQFLKPFNRNKVIGQVRGFLRDHVGPQDRVMLATYDKSLHVRHPFTSDRQAIVDALYEIETVSAFAVEADTARREVVRSIELSRTLGEAESHVDFYAKQVYNDLSGSLRALREIVGSLAGVPGRKALLYVSDGLPMTAAEDLFYMLDARFTSRSTGKLLASRYSARSRFRELASHANANRVTFYTLEAAGLRSHASLSAEYGGSGGSQVTDGSYVEVDFVRLTNTTEPLQMMALDTGGLAAFNTNNIAGALDAVAKDFRTYYSLGYMPAGGGLGRYHKIEVKVKGKGLKVRHRNGYRDKTLETRFTEGTTASLLYGLESNPLGIELQVAGGQRGEDGHYLVPLKVRIPIGKVTLIPQEEQHQGRVRVSVAVLDDKGRLSPVEQTRVPITIPAADLEIARSKFYVYEVQLLMREGEQSVAVGVHDDLAGETSYVRQPVRI